MTVIVTDVNDNFPDFANKGNITLMENEPFDNALAFSFTAVDADEPENGPPFSFEMACSTQGSDASTCVLASGQSFRLEFDPGEQACGA